MQCRNDARVDGKRRLREAERYTSSRHATSDCRLDQSRAGICFDTSYISLSARSACRFFSCQFFSPAVQQRSQLARRLSPHAPRWTARPLPGLAPPRLASRSRWILRRWALRRRPRRRRRRHRRWVLPRRARVLLLPRRRSLLLIIITPRRRRRPTPRPRPRPRRLPLRCRPARWWRR